LHNRRTSWIVVIIMLAALVVKTSAVLSQRILRHNKRQTSQRKSRYVLAAFLHRSSTRPRKSAEKNETKTWHNAKTDWPLWRYCVRARLRCPRNGPGYPGDLRELGTAPLRLARRCLAWCAEKTSNCALPGKKSHWMICPFHKWSYFQLKWCPEVRLSSRITRGTAKIKIKTKLPAVRGWCDPFSTSMFGCTATERGLANKPWFRWKSCGPLDKTCRPPNYMHRIKWEPLGLQW